jgi:hypothetical protein
MILPRPQAPSTGLVHLDWNQQYTFKCLGFSEVIYFYFLTNSDLLVGILSFVLPCANTHEAFDKLIISTFYTSIFLGVKIVPSGYGEN